MEGLDSLRRLNNVLDEAFNNWPFQQQGSGTVPRPGCPPAMCSRTKTR